MAEKMKNLTLENVVFAARKHDLMSKEQLKDDLVTLLNKMAWGLNWNCVADTLTFATAEGLLDLFKAARTKAAEQPQEPVVRMQVSLGEMKGQYIYEPSMALMVARIPGNETYFVYFCHPDSEEIERKAVGFPEPWMFLPVRDDLYAQHVPGAKVDIGVAVAG